MQTLAIPVLLGIGGLLAVQAAANVQLSTAVGTPFAASALQLGIGAVVLLALAAGAGALGALDGLGEVAWWQLAGGLGSALYITAGILLFPRLGALVAVGLFVAGQMLASVALDATGGFGMARKSIDAATVLGVVAVVAGTVLIVCAQVGEGVGRALRAGPGWLALGLGAGAVLPLQAATNASLRLELDEPLAVAAWSFVVATVAMAAVIGALAVARAARRPTARHLGTVPWWGWVGGLCGAAYVTSAFLLAPEIGVAATVALTIAGQQAASALLDRRGWLRMPRRPLTAGRLSGMGLLLAGVVLVQLA